jgi:hypothetical protein
MKHKYTKRRNMISRKIQKNKNNTKSKKNKKSKNLRKNQIKKYYQKGGIDTASADSSPPAYRDSYDEEIYSKLNK